MNIQTKLYKNIKNCKELNWQEKAIFSEIIAYQQQGKTFNVKDMTLADELAMDKGTVSKLINRLAKKGFINKTTTCLLSTNGGKPTRLRTITVKDISKWTEGNVEQSKLFFDNQYKTSYKPEELQEAINQLKEFKNIVVRAQDYSLAAYLRDIEKHFMDKQEKDKNRTI